MNKQLELNNAIKNIRGKAEQKEIEMMILKREIELLRKIAWDFEKFVDDNLNKDGA